MAGDPLFEQGPHAIVVEDLVLADRIVTQAGEFIEVTVFGQAEPTGSFAMAGPLIGMLLTRQLNVTLLNLKKLLESSG